MSKKKHYTTGVNTKGKTKTFCISCGWLIAHGQNLVELRLPQGVEQVECEGNHFTKLKIPESLIFLTCDPELFNYSDYNTSFSPFIDIHYGK